MQDNKTLYQSHEVVAKYAAPTTRVRSLNNAEKAFIDRFGITGKKVLILGSGVGRVPANLLLFGNTVTGIELSKPLHEASLAVFPKDKFPDLDLRQGDATDIRELPDHSFDLVWFPQNGLDYVTPHEMRAQALQEMGKKVKGGGLITFSSHNALAYAVSYKTPRQNYRLSGLWQPFYYAAENGVVGGGVIFKGRPSVVIAEAEQLLEAKFVGYTVDARHRLDSLLGKRLAVAQYIFPYILYVFKKNNLPERSGS